MLTSGDPERSLPLKILVVDDNLDGANTLCFLVRAWGYDCEVAYSGAIGLRSALAMRPAVVLSDIGMPDMNGYDLARFIRQQSSLKKTILIAISGYGSNEARELAQAAGFDLYYTKPLNPDILEKLLHSIATSNRAPHREQGQSNCSPAPSHFPLRNVQLFDN